jgi:hypothetical protein
LLFQHLSFSLAAADLPVSTSCSFRLLFWGLRTASQNFPLWTTADVEKSVVFFLGFLLIDVLTCALAFALRKGRLTLLIPVLLQRFYYRQLMYVVLFRS